MSISFPFKKMQKTPNDQKNSPITLVQLVDGFLRLDVANKLCHEFSIRSIRSINLLHDVDDKGLNGTIQVFIHKAVKSSKHSFGGRSSEKEFIGFTDTNSKEANYFRTKVRKASIPVIEL